MKKLLGMVVGVAATAGASMITPALGPVVGGALLGGAGGKEAGKVVERATGRPVHKIGAPVLAVGGASVGAQFIDPDTLCAAIQAACAHPMAKGSIVGLAVIGLHQIYLGLQRSGQRR